MVTTSEPDIVRFVSAVWAQTAPMIARAARAPARSVRKRVMPFPSIRHNNAGGISTEHCVGLFWEIVTVEDEVGLEFPGGVGADGDVLELQEPRKGLPSNGPGDVDVRKAGAEDEDCLGVDRRGVHGDVGTGCASTVVRGALEVHLERGATGDCDGDHGEDFHRRVIADADVTGSATLGGEWDAQEA